MKNKISILIAAFIISIGFNACTDDDNIRFQTVENPDQITFTNNFLSEYVLSQETAGNVAERFLWATPDFGAPTAINYTLEASLDGTFAEGDVQVLTTTNETQASISVGQLLNLAEDKGLSNTQVVDEEENPVFDENGDPVFNNTGELFFRVSADVGADFDGDPAENAPETVSATQIINVRWLLASTGGEEPVVLKNLFLVGNATAADWNNNNNNMPLIRFPDNENQYTITSRFLGNPNEFKLLETRGQWQPQWGINDGELAVNDGSGSDPGPFVVEGGEGYYTLTVNTEELTWSFDSFDASASPMYETIGIIGSATTGNDEGWAQDIDMTQSTFDPHLWYINGITLFDGLAKFRENNDWATNWGGTTALSGLGSPNGGDIPVAEGTYDVWFNDLDGSYIFIPVN